MEPPLRSRQRSSADAAAPVELRFADLFLLVIAALVFVVLSLSVRSFGAVRAVEPLRVLSDTLPVAAKGRSYELQLAAEGGEPPYSWRLLSGQLPRGLILTDLGSLAGTPAQDGAEHLRFRVSDARGSTAEHELLLTVRRSHDAVALLYVDARSLALPQATTGRAYRHRLVPQAGSSPYEVSTRSPLPPGLRLAPSGELSGTPVLAQGDARLGAPWQLAFRLRDGKGAVVEADAALMVRYEPPPVEDGLGAKLVRVLQFVLRFLAIPAVLIGGLVVLLLALVGFSGGRARATLGPVRSRFARWFEREAG